MIKTLENFKKELKKLDEYVILHEEKDNYLIIGKKISVDIQTKMMGHIFTPFQKIINKSFYVYFRMAFTEAGKIITDFDYLPTLAIDKSLISPSKPPKPSKVQKKFAAEQITKSTKSNHEPVYDEFTLMSDLENFIEKTYYS